MARTELVAAVPHNFQAQVNAFLKEESVVSKECPVTQVFTSAIGSKNNLNIHQSQATISDSVERLRELRKICKQALADLPVAEKTSSTALWNIGSWFSSASPQEQRRAQIERFSKEVSAAKREFKAAMEPIEKHVKDLKNHGLTKCISDPVPVSYEELRDEMPTKVTMPSEIVADDTQTIIEYLAAALDIKFPPQDPRLESRYNAFVKKTGDANAVDKTLDLDVLAHAVASFRALDSTLAAHLPGFTNKDRTPYFVASEMKEKREIIVKNFDDTYVIELTTEYALSPKAGEEAVATVKGNFSFMVNGGNIKPGVVAQWNQITPNPELIKRYHYQKLDEIFSGPSGIAVSASSSELN